MAIDRAALAEQHAVLEATAASFRDGVADEVPDMERLARAKWQFGYRLAIHLAQEDRHVYPALKTHSNPRISRLAALYQHEMGDLDQRFRHYLARWSSDRVVAEWPRFARETVTILDALAIRIRKEEEELYPLID